MITKLRNWWKQQQDRRFLRKHGCDNWKQYNHRYDSDINKRAVRINDFYANYPYVYCFEDHKHDIYYWDIAMDGMYVLDQWCEKNCKDKYRFDFHRAINVPATAYQWEINELGGSDYAFAAFKNEQDFLMFCLRWS
jgi:hypothetical protein